MFFFKKKSVKKCIQANDWIYFPDYFEMAEKSVAGCSIIHYWGLSKYSETKLQTTRFYLMLSFFRKIKRGLELVSLPHFPHNFWINIFLLLCSIDWPNYFLSGCLYFVRYWTICVLQLLVNQVVTSWILKLTLSF